MKRKINRVGTGTLTVSLPSTWATRHGLKQGDEVEVVEEGNTLSIATKSGIEKKNIALDVSGLLPRLVDRFLARSYQKGYDEIILKYGSTDILLAIQNKVPELLGFEILEKKQGYCTIRMIADKLNIDFDSALRKGFLVVLDMADTCIKAYNSNKKEELEQLYLRDLEVNKYLYFCLRDINKQFSAGFGTYILYYLIEILEDAGDEYKALATNLSKKLPHHKIISNILEDLQHLTNLAYTFFYSPKKELANEAFLLHKKIKSILELEIKINNIQQYQPILMNIYVLNSILYHFPTMRLDTLEGLK